MNTLLRLDEWKIISKENNDISVDGKIITNKNRINSIERLGNKMEDEVIDKLCGGIPNLETLYYNDNKKPGGIKTYYDVNSKTLSEVIGITNSDEYSCGYIKINGNENFNISNEDINILFTKKGGNAGKGEVLLSCLFPDVYMRNREMGEKGDCESNDFHIEVKSAGAALDWIDNGETDINMKCSYAISKYLCSNLAGCFDDEKPLLLIFFDNSYNDRVGNNDCKGFFWLNCCIIKRENKEKQRQELSNYILNKGILQIDYEQKNKEGKDGFAISVDKNGFICHVGKEAEV